MAQHLTAPRGPGQLLAPAIVLVPVGGAFLIAALEALKTSALVAALCAVPGLLVLGLLGFLLLLHIRAERVWAWHCRTGQVPAFKSGFAKGLLAGALVGVGVVALAFPVSVALASSSEFHTSEWGRMALGATMTLGVPVIAGVALLGGWAWNAWNKTALPAWANRH
jgi:hypothetical protein